MGRMDGSIFEDGPIVNVGVVVSKYEVLALAKANKTFHANMRFQYVRVGVNPHYIPPDTVSFQLRLLPKETIKFWGRSKAAHTISHILRDHRAGLASEQWYHIGKQTSFASSADTKSTLQLWNRFLQRILSCSVYILTVIPWWWCRA